MFEMLKLGEIEATETKLVRCLSSMLEQYLEPVQIDKVIITYNYARLAHQGQFRKTGEAYICHPLSVAISLAEMQMDMQGIMAAILHDVIEDTLVTKEQLVIEFGEQVAELVDGVTKLTKIDGKSRAETQAENVRKMFLAMAVDLRVIMVKLADRLHNMETLVAMPALKKRRIAKETMDIYVPIANRLNMNKMRNRLELLSFKSMYPLRYKVLKHAVKKARGHRKTIIETIGNAIKNRLNEAHLECTTEGREKNIPSIYKKMQRKKIAFSEVFDVYGFRIFTKEVDSCYRILGVIHNLYKPIPGRFKDYIALPKVNGYQALHTILRGPYNNIAIEIQIKTDEMDKLSESGIAAHWLYKEDSHQNFQAQANEWLRELLKIQQSVGNSLEFLENLKIDLFPQEIFVFTPQGEVIKLPCKATVVDFAYAVHTNIGTHCNSARIDKQLVSLQTVLENGITVEIITTDWARPNTTWLNYVVTAKARTGIRNYLKHFKQQEAIQLGERLLAQELQNLGLSLKQIPELRIRQLLEAIKMTSKDDLLEDIGLGNKMPFLIAKQMQQNDIYAAIKLNHNKNDQTPLIIQGTEGMVVVLAKCCRPIPGDTITGYFNPGKGIVIHCHDCRNSHDARKKQTTWLEIEWSQETKNDFPVGIRLEVINQRGTLATISTTIAKMKSNIETVSLANQDDKISVDLITLSVKSRVHLAMIMRTLKKLPIVLKITRIKA
jgi:RelA/SpoT family (p)ppGpp synthetase